jgi:hypothetical protein
MNTTEYENYMNLYKKEYEALEKDYSSLSEEQKKINDEAYRELSRKKSLELSRIWKSLTIDQQDSICGKYPDLSPEERAFRRGFDHGFQTARREKDLTESEVHYWRHMGDNDTYPPRSAIKVSCKAI